MIYFTSDLHFGHKNIIDYCSRPYNSVEEMDAALIANWNSRVTDKDTVYVLGDFAFAAPSRHMQLTSALQGAKILVRGNHDWRHLAPLTPLGFHAVVDELSLNLPTLGRVALNHFPPEGDSEAQARYMDKRPANVPGKWVFHGHVHNQWRIKNTWVNVGVDRWNYAPVSLDEILTEIRDGNPKNSLPFP